MNAANEKLDVSCRSVNHDWILRAASLTIENKTIFLKSESVNFRLGDASRNAVETIKNLSRRDEPVESSNILLGTDIRQRGGHLPSCGIIEIIDECEVKCATCIANSLPGTGNARTRASVFASASKFSRSFPGAPIMLSGGEPTLHRELVDIIRDVSVLPNPIYLITNGIKLSRDKGFAKALHGACENLTIYLQFDSTDTADIQLLRTPEMNAQLRESAINVCEEAKLHYVLVSVIAKGVNDRNIGKTFDRHFANEYLRGITLQPIKLVGRNKFATTQNELTRFDVDQLVREQIGISLADHPENQLNWSTLQFYNDQSLAKASCGNIYTLGFEGKHVSVVWHSSRTNYVFESCFQNPVVFLDEAGSTPLEFHYD